MRKNNSGFTLVELLVVIAIIGMILAITIFGTTGVRQSARDSKRKADLQLVASQLEIYKSDCNYYPMTLISGAGLAGTNNPSTCSSSNTYINSVPTDPSAGRNYVYVATPVTCLGPLISQLGLCTGFTYWTSLEGGGSPPSYCGSAPTSGCGTGATCNYCVKNP